MDDDDGDGDDPTIIIDVSAWPRVSFARAEERLFEADGAPAASFDAAGARGEAAYAAAFRRAFAALGAAPEDASVVAVADVVRDGAARAACAAAALGDLRCRRAAAAGAAWCGLLGHCTQEEPQAVWKSNLQPDFNMRVIERFGSDPSALLRELDESDRFVQKSAESTSI